MDKNLVLKGTLRDGQEEAIQVIKQRIKQQEPYTAIVLPTRYGKSDVIRLSSYLLKEYGLISTTIALSPNTVLRDQLVAPLQIYKMWERYNGPRDISLNQDEDPLPENLGREGEHLTSLTTQMVTQRISEIVKWTDYFIHKHKKPVMFFMDECHNGSDANVWGGAIKRLIDVGAKAVLCTATPFRDDAEKILGFDYENIGEESVEFKTYTDIDDNLVRVDVKTGKKYILKLKAHHETSFKEAWRADPAIIMHMSRFPFDVKVRLNGDKNNIKKLSEMTLTESKKHLGSICRRQDVISAAVEAGIKDMMARRRATPDSATICFCCNDATNDNNDVEANIHAKIIKETFHNMDKSLRVEIVTSKLDNNANEFQARAKEKMTNFLENGKGDILIVKQMASVGVDCPRIKTVIDLSSNRTVAGSIQKYMRGATPHGEHTSFSLITPNDFAGRKCFESFFEKQGGDANAYDIETTDTYIKEKKPGPNWEPSDVEIIEICPSGFNDTKGNVAEASSQKEVEKEIRRFPELLKLLTHAEISKRINEEETKESTPSEIINTTTQKKNLISVINPRAKSMAGTLMHKQGIDYATNKDLFKDYKKAIQRYWSREATGKNTSKLKARSIEDLKKIEAFSAIQEKEKRYDLAYD